MEFGKADWGSFERGIEKEWLLTNGIGGFASSTIIGANTRRYHGLLVAAMRPPVQRHLVLSKIDECIIINGQSHNLFSYKTPDYVMKGFYNLQRVVVDPLPTFTYSVEDIFVEKKIAMVYGENTVVVVYRIISGGQAAKLRLTPLVNYRDYHQNSSRAFMRFNTRVEENRIAVKPYELEFDIDIYCSDSSFTKLEDCFFMNMDYPIEKERGLQSTEDHYIPGYFDVDIKPGEDKYITVIATVEGEIKSTDGLTLIGKEEKRIKGLVEAAGYEDELARGLVAAADNFIVYRKSTDAKTIIAGYPWFTDWGRDTMIAFTGLTLATKRFNDAKEILYTFSKYVKYGLIPNVFPDGDSGEPPYNSVDGAMWYFEAVNKYIAYTGDYEFVKENIYGVLKEIIEGYTNGTKFNIKMDEDYLISAGDKSTQLTWMDAKIGNWVVTPRHGKAVEINALWYNALKVMAVLADKFGEDGKIYEERAAKVKVSFEKAFWNEEKQCLYDVITGDFKDDKVRPNQVIAASLSNPVMEGEMAQKVVNKVWVELYTSYGLRTLSPQSKEFIGIYIGDQYRRDSAYHQGTVWPWPLGHFITAFLKANGYTEENKKKAMRFVEPFKDHLRDACIGSISEIFDGSEPTNPRGCFAQAWSVAEILRAYTEDVIG